MAISISGVTYEEGVDVSNHQGVCNWSDAKAAADLKFAWCKASEGTGYTDPFYDGNIAGAQANQLVAGAYHFMHPNGDGAAQGRFFLDHLRGDELLAPVCDAESHETADPRRNTREILRWFEVVEAAINRRAVFYSYMPWIAANLHADPALAERPLWAASYGPNNGQPNTPPTAASPWPQWTAWQYTSTRPMPGLGAGIDANLATAETLNGLLMHPREIGVSPVGFVDRVVPAVGEVEVLGWAADPDDLDSHTKVHVYVDGEYAVSAMATQRRPDVTVVFPEYGERRGFGITFPCAPGQRRIETFALDSKGGTNAKIGEHTVTVLK